MDYMKILLMVVDPVRVIQVVPILSNVILIRVNVNVEKV